MLFSAFFTTGTGTCHLLGLMAHNLIFFRNPTLGPKLFLAFSYCFLIPLVIRDVLSWARMTEATFPKCQSVCARVCGCIIKLVKPKRGKVSRLREKRSAELSGPGESFFRKHISKKNINLVLKSHQNALKDRAHLYVYMYIYWFRNCWILCFYFMSTLSSFQDRRQIWIEDQLRRKYWFSSTVEKVLLV